MGKGNSKSSFFKKVIISLMTLFLLSAVIGGWSLYKFAYKPNTNFTDKKNRYLYIKSTDTFQDILNQLSEKGIIKDLNTFKFIAEYKKYPDKIKPGKYQIKQGIGNNQLVNLLKAGFSEKIKLNFYNLNTPQEFAGRVAKHTEADSIKILEEIISADFEEKYGISQAAALSLVIANEYELEWSTSCQELFKLLKDQYKAFWNEERTKKAEKLGLTQTECSILASIVQKEQTQHPEERPNIASVYFNRLKSGMKLQADPTVIYAVGDFTINRVLNKHLEVNSPYNTYKNEGLPPGPICIPTKNALDAVLNLPQNNYLFFCARADLSGYHTFTKDYQSHLVCARKYQQALDKRGIK
jgi:UPF0755 protein